MSKSRVSGLFLLTGYAYVCVGFILGSKDQRSRSHSHKMHERRMCRLNAQQRLTAAWIGTSSRECGQQQYYTVNRALVDSFSSVERN